MRGRKSHVTSSRVAAAVEGRPSARGRKREESCGVSPSRGQLFLERRQRGNERDNHEDKDGKTRSRVGGEGGDDRERRGPLDPESLPDTLRLGERGTEPRGVEKKDSALEQHPGQAPPITISLSSCAEPRDGPIHIPREDGK